MSRLRGASKAPLAVAGILAVPVFFVALMAFSLRLDKPSHHLSAAGKVVLGDPTKGTVGTIYALALLVAVAVVVVGLLAMLLRSRLGAVAPAVAGIVASVLLLIPLASWAAGHTDRYPLGIDNIPPRSPQDLYLRGEWEQNARTTAHQIGYATIGIAVAVVLVTLLWELRRRRGSPDLLLTPSPIDVELDSGGAPQITG